MMHNRRVGRLAVCNMIRHKTLRFTVDDVALKGDRLAFMKMRDKFLAHFNIIARQGFRNITSTFEKDDS